VKPSSRCQTAIIRKDYDDAVCVCFKFILEPTMISEQTYLAFHNKVFCVLNVSLSYFGYPESVALKRMEKKQLALQ
jgi:hypothetical protein